MWRAWLRFNVTVYSREASENVVSAVDTGWTTDVSRGEIFSNSSSAVAGNQVEVDGRPACRSRGVRFNADKLELTSYILIIVKGKALL